MLIRRAVPADFAAIAALGAANAFDALTPAERAAGGFLSGRLTEAACAQMAAGLALMLALDGATVAGFVVAGRNEAAEHPVVRAMLTQYARLRFGGRPLTAWRTYVYGPACVAAPYRGRGVLRALFDALRREVGDAYEVGVGFVDGDNRRSLAAHVRTLGMTDAGSFTLDARAYHVIAYRQPP